MMGSGQCDKIVWNVDLRFFVEHYHKPNLALVLNPLVNFDGKCSLSLEMKWLPTMYLTTFTFDLMDFLGFYTKIYLSKRFSIVTL